MRTILSFFLLSLLFVGCTTENTELEWIIPKAKVFDGGPGKDGIPALDNLDFTSVDDPAGEITFIDADELVLAVKFDGEVRLYPHPILNWHEIANDAVGDHHFAVTYCPLTGTGIAWSRVFQGEVTTFGVSGLLYNSNLIPYDRATDSNWSQMRLDCVAGNRIEEEAQTYNLIEMPWTLARIWFPEAKVMIPSDGFDRNYDRYPYGSYKTNNNLIFPVNHQDDRLHKKERVMGVILESEAKIYRFTAFPEQGGVLTDDFAARDLILFGDPQENVIAAYEAVLPDGTRPTFTWQEAGDGIVATDEEGNNWNIFGEAVSGPRAGQRLTEVPAFMGYWFSWVAFYPELEVVGL